MVSVGIVAERDYLFNGSTRIVRRFSSVRCKITPGLKITCPRVNRSGEYQ